MTKQELINKLGPITKLQTITKSCIYITHTNGKSLYCYDNLVAFKLNDYENIFLTMYYKYNKGTSTYLTDWCKHSKEERDKMIQSKKLFILI
jgi:hypothetical protein